jgi:hypothetical protein
MTAQKIRVDVVDVNGSFARFSSRAPKAMRAELKKLVTRIANRVSDEMYDKAPPRSEVPPHVRDAIDVKQVGLTARVGILDGEGDSGTDATMGEVALFNEYSPNRQPFVRPAAVASERPAAEYASKTLAAVERELAL